MKTVAALCASKVAEKIQVTPFFAHPPEVRRIIYTTNAIESPHMRLRQIVKSRGPSPF